MADISKINVNNTDYDIKDAVARGLIWQGTQAQYDAITTKDPNVVYFITDGETVACDADEVLYDNTTSGLSATDVQDAIDELSNEKADSSSLAEVATSGSYNDLDDKPTIPAAQVNSDWNSSSGVSEILNKPSLATVATSGSYTDLSNTPAVDTSVTSGSSNLITSGAVYTAIDNLPEPMVFKGSLGTGGTITVLPVDGSADIGDTYKVITAGTYASQPAKAGDTFICDSKTSSANTWVLIPSGDEPSGTVTSIKIQANSPISVDSSSAITTSGTRTISHDTSGASAGNYGDTSPQTPGYGSTFKALSATVDKYGHVTSIGEHTVKIPNAPTVDTTLSGSSNNAIANSAVNTALDNKMEKNIEKSASGSLVSFNDGGDNIPLKSLIVNITAVQSGSGTPSPTNVRAISGWSGANIVRNGVNQWNEVAKQGYTISGEGVETPTSNTWCSQDYILLLPNTTYYLKSSSYLNARWYDANKNYLGYSVLGANSTFNSTSAFANARYLRFNGYGTTYNNDISINYPSTDTSYHAYTGTTHTIQFGQTVYGGTLDVLSGVLTVTHIAVKLDGTVSFYNFDGYTDKWRASIFSQNIKSSYLCQEDTKCSHFTVGNYSGWGSLLQNEFMIASNTYVAFGYTGNFNDYIAEQNQANTPIIVVGVLATPIIYQLTPAQVSTLLGLNNIFADTGDISLSYFTQNANAINDIAESNTRTALNTDVPKTDLTDIFVTGTKNNTGSTISAGTYFYVNNQLALCKQDIGATNPLTLNTNYELVTAGALNKLMSRENPTGTGTLTMTGNGIFSDGLKLHTNQNASTLNTTSSITASGGTLDCSSYSDGAIIFLYRPSANKVGIYVKTDTWTRIIPIVPISTVSVSGYVITNNDTDALRGSVIST